MTGRGRILLGAWAPVAAWCALVFTLSSLPLRVDPSRVPGGDKTAHVVEYAVLGFLLARALRRSRPGMGGGAVVAAAALLGTVYGAGDEFHQSFVPEREASLGDLAADAAGSLLGAAALVLVARRRTDATVRSPSPPTGEPSRP